MEAKYSGAFVSMGLPVAKSHTVFIPPCKAVTGFSRDEAIDTHAAHYAVLRRFLRRFKAVLRYPCVQSRGYRFQEGFRFLFFAVFGEAVVYLCLVVRHGLIAIRLPRKAAVFCAYARFVAAAGYLYPGFPYTFIFLYREGFSAGSVNL